MPEMLHRTILYHGALASDIQALQRLKLVGNHPVGWLGAGIYFWDHSSYAAECWAMHALDCSQEQSVGAKACVGQLFLEVDEQEWIDLNDPWTRAEFIDFTTNYDDVLNAADLEHAWSRVAQTRHVSIWGFWFDLWIRYLEETQDRTIRGVRAVIRHQGFTFNANVPRLEGHSVHDMKGFERRKRSRKDSSNAVDFDGERHPRLPDAGIAWVLRCPDLIRRVRCWPPPEK